MLYLHVFYAFRYHTFYLIESELKWLSYFNSIYAWKVSIYNAEVEVAKTPCSLYGLNQNRRKMPCLLPKFSPNPGGSIELFLGKIKKF